MFFLVLGSMRASYSNNHHGRKTKCDGAGRLFCVPNYKRSPPMSNRMVCSDTTTKKASSFLSTPLSAKTSPLSRRSSANSSCLVATSRRLSAGSTAPWHVCRAPAGGQCDCGGAVCEDRADEYCLIGDMFDDQELARSLKVVYCERTG